MGVSSLGRYAYQRKQQKYNPHHGARGRFSIGDEAVWHVSRDGSRTKGPKHPDNQQDELTKLGIAPTKEWVKEFEGNRVGVLQVYAEKHGMTVAQYKAAVDKQAQDLANESTLFTRVKPATLQHILESGRFKTVFETNTSGGSKTVLAKEARRTLEAAVFGTPKETLNRPIYGYLSKDAHGENVDADVSQYGNVALKMKPSVRDRTTMTSGDSLTLTGGGYRETLVPRPVNHPDNRIYPMYNSTDPLADNFGKYRYVEAQMHGGVKSSDIESVTFHGKGPGAPLKKALKEAGISFTIMS